MAGADQAAECSRRNWIRMIALLLYWLVTANAAHAQAPGPMRFEFTQVEMGVQFRLVFYASSAEAANKAATATFDRIKELNDILSDYDSNSELMKLCTASSPGHPVEVGPDLWNVLKSSDEISRLSDGAFDVTVGHLTKLWRRARRQKQLPEPQELKLALSSVGYRLVELRTDAERRLVELKQAGMRLDLGGIAKGYASDEALKVLRKHGITRALVAASGDVAVADAPPDQDAWTVAVESPSAPGQNIRKLKLVNQAVSTSGDAYQFVEIDGKRYSHILSPRTGLGLTQRGSATVISTRGITTDAVDTAVVILGPKRGLELIAKLQKQGEQIEVLNVLVDETNTPHETMSPGFAKFVVQEADQQKKPSE